MKEMLAIDMREFMQEYFDAWREGVTEKILSYYSNDVVINLLGVPALLEGKPSVTENFVLPFTRAFPDNVHKIRTSSKGIRSSSSGCSPPSTRASLPAFRPAGARLTCLAAPYIPLRADKSRAAI